MDELEQYSTSNPLSQPLSAELTMPMDGKHTTAFSEETSLQSHDMTIPSEIVSAASIPPTVVAATSSLSFLERYWKLALLVILVLAFALRTRGLNWDEGQHLHPDERFLTMVETAIKLPSSLGQYFDTTKSPLNPYNNNFGSFVYGTAPLFFVRLIAELIGLAAYEKMVLLGRALSALADVFVLGMTFAIGRRLYGLRIGLLAAVLYAFSVLPIKQSHFFTVDTFTNIPLMLAFWFTLDIWEGKRGVWAFVLAGLCFGLMLASRINLAPFAAIIGLAALLRLIKLLEDVELLRVEVNGLNIKKTFETRKAAALDSPKVDETLPMRSLRIGPFLVEIEFKPRALVESERVDAKTSPWVSLRPILVGLVLSAIAAIVIFRIAQPYAFDGFFHLNSQFLDDMAKAQRVVSGQDDYPPSHQWTNREPYWFPWYNIVFWGLGPALGFAAWLGVALAAFQVLQHRRWDHLLVLLWVVGMFFYHGQQFVLTMRYFLPLYPFLAIFAAFFLVAMWEQAKALKQTFRNERVARSTQYFAGLLFVTVIALTFFWAVASTSVYTRTNTRVAASRWIYANVSDSEVLGSEHWDDVLPLRVDGKDYYSNHEGVMLELYGDDNVEKREKMVEWMDQVDYIILSSNRLYGSIPRLPMRFPLTTKYYEWLFNGQLGFEVVQEFTSYPQFLGITVIDDNAEEAFTVYDHPKVTIFKKTPEYSHDNIVKLFYSVDLSEVLRLKPIDAAASRRQFQMTPIDLAANRNGGTWRNLFNPNDLANQFPIHIWLLMVWGIGVLTFPFTFITFRSFLDRGYAFAKALGILLVAWFAWTLSSYHILPFGRLPILLGLIALTACSFLIIRKNWQELRGYIRANLTVLLIEELVFFAFFAIDLFFRLRNPDLWHPWMGGERPMDFAFLNAILKTTYFPPYNPWFAGNYINYYYFGQLISAVLIRLSGITSEVAYNLLIPLFFALTASGAYGVVFNVVFSGRQRFNHKVQSAEEETSTRNLLIPNLAGIFAVILVLLIGNLGEIKLALKGLGELGGGSGIIAVMNGLKDWLVDGKTIPIRIGDWYWTSTRVIPDTINEFPFFTFIYGDLHAHLIAIPYALVALGLAAHFVLSNSKLKWSDLALIALVLGALRAINTWDYPTYLGLIGAAMILRFSSSLREVSSTEEFHWHEWLQQWLRFILIVFSQLILIMVPMNLLGIRMTVEVAIYILILLFGALIAFNQAGKSWVPYQLVHKVGWPFLGMIALSVFLFLPYILNYATGYVSAERWEGVHTTLSEYTTVHGIFLFIAATFFIMVILTNHLRENPQEHTGLEMSGGTIYWLVMLGIAEIVLIVWNLPILALVFPLLASALWIFLHPKTSIEIRWVTILILTSILLTLFVEITVLKGDIGRMNTVFKFYLQSWVIFGVAGATGLGLIIHDLVPTRKAEFPLGKFSSVTSQRIRWTWWGALTLLMIAGLLYPVAASWAKMNDRYVEASPPGLNGMHYMQRGATYNENNQQLDLRWDYEAIQWIRKNVKGSPVIMEGNTGLYHWGNRYSIYTGLPTIIGWDWHTKQQYSLLPGDLIDYRVDLVEEFYNTPNQARALEIAHRYDVSYVIVGGVEHAVYDAIGLSKFDRASDVWNLVYQNKQVKIYQVP